MLYLLTAGSIRIRAAMVIIRYLAAMRVTLLSVELTTLIAGRAGDDRLEGNDALEGDSGADYFNCGDEIDIVLDFEPADGDIITIDCETS